MELFGFGEYSNLGFCFNKEPANIKGSRVRLREIPKPYAEIVADVVMDPVIDFGAFSNCNRAPIGDIVAKFFIYAAREVIFSWNDFIVEICE